jgi:hypothetical protein
MKPQCVVDDFMGGTMNDLSSVVTLLLSRIMPPTCLMSLSVLDVNGNLRSSASVILVPPFLNLSIHSHALCSSKALFL